MLKRRITAVILFAVLAVLLLSGCTRIKFTTGLSKDEFAKCGDMVISTDISDLLFAEQKYSYENLFNNNVWSENIGNMTMEEYITDSVKNTIANFIYLNRIADELRIVLTDEEKRKVDEAVTEYMAMSEEISEDAVQEIYTLILRAEKAFYAMTDDVDTEVSNDEARIISVQYVFISTMVKNEDGTISAVSESEYNRAKRLAEEIYKAAKNGSDMISLATEKSSDSIHSMELGRGQYNREFENAAFDLEIGEISDVVETEYGFYVIKCINDNIESNIAKRKAEIVLGRRREIFLEQYEKYIDKNDIMYNKKYLKNIDIKSIQSGNGKLFEVYKNDFVSTQVN